MTKRLPEPDTQDHTPWHEGRPDPDYSVLVLMVPMSWLLMAIFGVVVWWLA